MSKLFDLLCDDYKALLEKKEMTPADRKTLIEFLKNNDITAVPAQGSALGNLVSQLPFNDDDHSNVVNMRK